MKCLKVLRAESPREGGIVDSSESFWDCLIFLSLILLGLLPNIVRTTVLTTSSLIVITEHTYFFTSIVLINFRLPYIITLSFTSFYVRSDQSRQKFIKSNYLEEAIEPEAIEPEAY